MTDNEWDRIKDILLLGHLKSGQRRCPVKHGNRKVMNGILWIAENGVPRRELPERYRPWQAVYARFRPWKRREIRGGLQRLATNF